MVEPLLSRTPVPFLVGGRWETGTLPPHELQSFTGAPPHPLVAMDKKDGSWEVARPGTDHLQASLDAIAKGQEILSHLPPYRRRAILEETARGIEENRTSLAHLITAEVGKPSSAALFEVDRAIATFRVAADLSTTTGHHFQPGNLVPQGTGMVGLVERVSAGGGMQKK